jgi:two-component system, OmpR family, sensor kinase
MTRLGLRTRFALLAAALVLAIAALVGAGGYLALRASLLSRADREATDQARQLAALVDAGGRGGENSQANQVDLSDPSLTHGFSRAGLLVTVARATGKLVQATPRAPSLPAPVRGRCLHDGRATTRLDRPAVALACARVGPAARPLGTVSAATPLADEHRALARLAQALAMGVAAGTLVAAALARAVAQRALRPARQIAQTADSIRSGDLGRRIAYRGPRDELGTLADTLDACFAELQQGVKRQRRFVADASHELRTPVATVRAHVELLRGWASETPAARAAALLSLDQASRSASRLVADLLYLAQLDRLPPAPRAPAQLDQVLLDAVRETQPLRPEVVIRVARLDEAALLGDELRLRQLLVNLLTNALRVTPDRGEVTAELAATHASAEVTIADQGPGIAADQLERIFERFHTADPRQAGSAGLGLAIAREITQRHDGDLRAENRTDCGALFRVTLPLGATPPWQPSSQNASAPARRDDDERPQPASARPAGAGRHHEPGRDAP